MLLLRRETQHNTNMKTRKISQYKSESHYALGDYRIDITRRTKGDGVYAKRESWSDVVIWSMAKKGVSRQASSLADAAQLINSGKCQLA